jgi:nitroreductase
MDALEAIAGRKVIRAFADRPVEPDKLRRIIDAGRHAMSARNLQPWQFIVVQDRGRLKEIGELCSTGRFISASPAAIVVLKDVANSRWADIDCAHAVQNMANAAWALGLGTCWVGNFDAQQIAAMLELPQGWTILTILPFGYPDPANPAQPRPLKPRSEVVHYERFGQTKA